MIHQQIQEIQMLEAKNKIEMNDLHKIEEEKYNIFRNDQLFLDCLHYEDAINLLRWYSRLFKNDKYKIEKI